MKRLITIALLCLLPISAMAENNQVEIHGMASQGYIKSTDNNFFCPSKKGTLEYNEMAVNLVTVPVPSLRIGMQFFAHDLGENGDDQIQIDWLVCDYQINEKIGARIGKIKIPMGLYNTNRDIDMLRVSIFLPQGVYAEEQRDANLAIRGAGLYGFFSSSSLGSLEYEGVYGTTEVNEGSIGALMAEDKGLGDPEYTFDYKYATGLIWNTPINGLRFGTTYQQTKFQINGVISQINLPITMDNKAFQVGTVSAEYTFNQITLASEFLQRHMEFELKPLNGKTDEDAIGQYVSGAYRFTDWFELGAYYSEFYPRRDNKDGHRRDQLTNELIGYRAWMKDCVLSLRFDVNQNFILKAEGHYIDGVAGLLTVDNKEGFKRYWSMYALKATYSF